MRWYARPEGDNLQLRVAPRLASWNKADHPDQVRLRAFLDDTEALLAASQVDGREKDDEHPRENWRNTVNSPLDYRAYEIRQRQVTAPPDGETYGTITVSNDAVQFRIIAEWNSAPYGYGKVGFTDRDTARAVGTALLTWAGNENPLADQQWTSDDGTVVRVTVEPATPFLHIGDCFWPLAIDDAIDLGQRLIVWAGLAL